MQSRQRSQPRGAIGTEGDPGSPKQLKHAEGVEGNSPVVSERSERNHRQRFKKERGAFEKRLDFGSLSAMSSQPGKETKQFKEAQSALKKAVASPQDFKEKSLAQAALKDLVGLK